MTPANPSPAAPTLFGRLPKLLSEEERLTAVTASLRELCGALEVGVGSLPARLEPARLLDEIGSVLAGHFQSAEVCLTAIASCRHDLLPAVVDMRSDHAGLLRSLADLRLLVAERARWVELPRHVTRLLEWLSVHRECETALIRQAADLTNAA